MFDSVEDIRRLLEAEAMAGIDVYGEKLAANRNASPKYRDLRSEAYAALMFVTAFPRV